MPENKKIIRDNFESLVRDYLHLRIELKLKIDLYNQLEKRLKTYVAMGYLDESIFDSKYEFIGEKKN